MRQKKLSNFLKDYDFNINYQLGKANLVTDPLSRNTSSFITYLNIQRNSMVTKLVDMKLELLRFSDMLGGIIFFDRNDYRKSEERYISSNDS